MPDRPIDALRQVILNRSKGVCECEMETCTHHVNSRCPHSLRGPWHVRRLDAGGEYIANNVKALCQTCHGNTPSHGP